MPLNKKEKPVMSFSFHAWRKMRDSNPRLKES